ncbi:hypothetical protein NDU88_008109 [Pleurodeles waltl]|uniref:Uncharacterized protein n=1 Tax=Pleurodeles waltl TaxID=8319 RepID=A0AAV7QMN8_PLEWA|nr:hypothetical protein NDU88_008109 [Pleurodeles waltl]
MLMASPRDGCAVLLGCCDRVTQGDWLGRSRDSTPVTAGADLVLSQRGRHPEGTARLGARRGADTPLGGKWTGWHWGTHSGPGVSARV